MSCPCSIFDVREEQILETNGALRIRLVCNVCGSLIDSKVVIDGTALDGTEDPPRPAVGDEGVGVRVGAT